MKPKYLTKGEIVALLGIILIGLLVNVFFFPSRESSSSNPSVARNTTGALEYRIKGDNWLGCADRAQFGRLTNYAIQGDMEVYKRELAIGLAAGTVVLFKPGELVYLMKAPLLTGLVELRRKGEVQTYWACIESIQ